MDLMSIQIIAQNAYVLEEEELPLAEALAAISILVMGIVMTSIII